MIWRPLDLAEVCTPYTELSACSYFGYVYLNLLVQLFGGSRDHRLSQKYRNDAEDERIVGKIDSYKHQKNEEEYDFIVVGAGSAGCVVANRLSESKKWKVLLLEAGPEQPDVSLVPGLSTALLGSNVDWAYSTEPDGKSCLAQPNGRCSWSRGKMMGGSSSINSLAYVRGSKVDYDTWAALGNAGWSYADVLPYFKKSERNLNVEGLDRKYHGVTGEQYVSRYPYIDKPSVMMTEAFHERGLPIADFNGANQMAAIQAQAFSLDGERVSANTAFISPVRYKRRNLKIKTNSEAVKILIDDRKRAYGVIYTRNKRKYTAIAKKEVIVSSGAINSPKLLMLSGIGPREQLESLGISVVQDLPVGENLHDHVTFNGIVIALPNATATLRDNEEVIEKIIKYARQVNKEGPLSSNGPVNSVSFIKTSHELPAPDIQYQVDSVRWREYVSEPTEYDRTRIFPTCFYDGMVPRTMNLVPRSRGRLCLNTTDPNGYPLLYANYFGDENDLIPLIKGVRFLLSLENTKAFQATGAHFLRIKLPACRGYEWGSDEYTVCLARQYTSTPYHPVGTCKLGPKWDKSAVVSPRLQVYGVGRLRVIDASIMPIVPRGNTNAPTLMVGERGVTFVIEDWTRNQVNH